MAEPALPAPYKALAAINEFGRNELGTTHLVSHLGQDKIIGEREVFGAKEFDQLANTCYS